MRAGEGVLAASDHAAPVLLAATLATPTAALTAAVAGYPARREHAPYPQVIIRAAAAFATTLTPAAAAAATLRTLIDSPTAGEPSVPQITKAATAVATNPCNAGIAT